jgi:transcriptional regulator
MFIPSAFELKDPDIIAELVDRHSFGVIASSGGEEPFVSHLPLVYEPDRGEHGTLLAHLAAHNPHAAILRTGGPVRVIITGPHGYVSPLWYQARFAVPTWNYAAVHLIGHPTMIDDSEGKLALVEKLSARHDAEGIASWAPLADPKWPAYIEKMLAGIVGVEIAVQRVEAKGKLSQNRPKIDRDAVISAFANSDREAERETAELMRRLEGQQANASDDNQATG